MAVFGSLTKPTFRIKEVDDNTGGALSAALKEFGTNYVDQGKLFLLSYVPRFFTFSLSRSVQLRYGPVSNHIQSIRVSSPRMLCIARCGTNPVERIAIICLLPK